uniref:Vasotocin-neurophysin VT 1-like n=1 Tax=Sinocyclocheilus grahami TaxID=75366 RepID=A0A672MFN0_SINGR
MCVCVFVSVCVCVHVFVCVHVCCVCFVSVCVCCPACGPGNQGHCFGPSICCGAGLGCLLGSPDTLSCMEENLLPGPCETDGTSCGAPGGRCASPGVCCNSESCVLDPDCSEVVGSHQTEDGVGLKGVSGEMLLRLLNLATRRQRPF